MVRRTRGSGGGIAARSAGRRPDAGLPLLEVDLPAGSDGHWLRTVGERWPLAARVRVCRPLVRRPMALLQVVELAGTEGDLDAAEEYILGSSGLEGASVVRLSPGRRLVRGTGGLPPACLAVFRTAAVCTSCRFVRGTGRDRPDRWTLVLPRDGTIRQALAALRDRSGGPGVPLLRARNFRARASLTPRQAAAIETAYRLGFYAYPRRAALGAIARELSVSRPAAAELLRRAESKLLGAKLLPSE